MLSISSLLVTNIIVCSVVHILEVYKDCQDALEKDPNLNGRNTILIDPDGAGGQPMFKARCVYQNGVVRTEVSTDHIRDTMFKRKVMHCSSVGHTKTTHRYR